MIAVKLMGGLGNQLFQYAAGRALAELRGEELYLDLSWLNADPLGAYTKREFELSQIRYKARVANASELKDFGLGNVFSRAMNKLGLRSHRVFNEHRHSFLPEFFELKGNVLLNGYWQSEKYFSGIRSALLDEIGPAYHFSDHGQRLRELVLVQNSVSVHVRRGDLVTFPAAQKFHGLCSVDYYREAAALLLSAYGDLIFYVYSDDMDWCRKELSFLPNAVFLPSDSVKPSSQDMFVMSHCRHHIIANSSYSWWTAWLSRREGKVVAPAKWFADPSVDTADICPESWIRI